MSVKIEGLNHESFKFNGGEIHVRLAAECLSANVLQITARLNSADDIMELVMVSNALRISYPERDQALFMPYVPYARQDRVCNDGEALAIKAFAQIINALNFTTVTTLDNHSDVATAVLDRCDNMSMDMWLDNCYELTTDFANHEHRAEPYVLIAPDAGARKKTLELAKNYWGLPVINCDKHRDTATGKILGTYVQDGHRVAGKCALIVDDICDGGRTFIEIAEVLKTFSPFSIELAVTHGIFSKGLQPLLDSGISHIYTTDSFSTPDPKGLYGSRLTVVQL